MLSLESNGTIVTLDTAWKSKDFVHQPVIYASPVNIVR